MGKTIREWTKLTVKWFERTRSKNSRVRCLVAKHGGSKAAMRQLLKANRGSLTEEVGVLEEDAG